MGNSGAKLVDKDTTCAEVLGSGDGDMNVGGFCGYNFVIDNQRDVTTLYKIGKKLGQGSYACVYKAVNKSTEKEHAIKIINKSNCKNVHRVLLEIAVMKSLDHPNILRIYETFEDADNFYLILEECRGGDLFERIVRQKRLSEMQSATCMEQIFRYRASNFCIESQAWRSS